MDAVDGPDIHPTARQFSWLSCALRAPPFGNTKPGSCSSSYIWIRRRVRDCSGIGTSHTLLCLRKSLGMLPLAWTVCYMGAIVSLLWIPLLIYQDVTQTWLCAGINRIQPPLHTSTILSLRKEVCGYATPLVHCRFLKVDDCMWRGSLEGPKSV